jgi:C4-dicarboxylate-specific signal transduction histidine kinase
MSLGAVLALNDDGRPLRMVGVSRDITEQKQAREEIDQQRNALYHMNRTATMGELTASLAHELNQPLAAIMTNAQAAKRLLEKEPADLAEAAEALDDIIQDDHRAGETILRIRRMLQKGEIEMAPVEINHLIREVAEFLNSEIIARNVLIHLDLSPNSRLVMGDRIQLQQVLLNLMLNACEAMASSEIEHKVLIIRSDTRSADRVSVSVRDTGCGIAPERLQEIFKLFHSSKAMGMGAGLAICRSIITAHGGEIWAENNQDRGATFTFKLPTISQQDPAQGPPS